MLMTARRIRGAHGVANLGFCRKAPARPLVFSMTFCALIQCHREEQSSKSAEFVDLWRQSIIKPWAAVEAYQGSERGM